MSESTQTNAGETRLIEWPGIRSLLTITYDPNSCPTSWPREITPAKYFPQDYNPPDEYPVMPTEPLNPYGTTAPPLEPGARIDELEQRVAALEKRLGENLPNNLPPQCEYLGS